MTQNNNNNKSTACSIYPVLTCFKNMLRLAARPHSVQIKEFPSQFAPPPTPDPRPELKSTRNKTSILHKDNLQLRPLTLS